jgi:copper homeostasis protein CutC
MQTHPMRKELKDIHKRLECLPQNLIARNKSEAFKMHQEDITHALDEVVQLSAQIQANLNSQPEKILTQAEKKFNQAKAELEHLKKSIHQTISCIKQSQARL